MKKLIIERKDYLNQIINSFKKDWTKNIQILADFDRTLTKSFYKWKKRPSIISILRNNWYLWQDYSKQAFSLYEKYYPIQSNPNINLETKKEKMKEWWSTHLKLLIKSKLNKNDIDKVINSWNIELRDWVKEFLEILNKNNIPLIIISANWLGWDSIKLFLKKQKLYFTNIHIISNKFNFDKNWYAIWYSTKIIHSFNKDETILKDYPKINKIIQNKKNVILLWDSIWDVWMIKWFDYENLIKIWFLNENTQELLNEYKKNYNIICTWDNDANFLIKLINKII